MPHGQFKNRRDALVSFLLKSLSYIFWCIGAKKTFFPRLLLFKFMLHNAANLMPQNISESETSQNYLVRNPICANRK